ncbi:MAG TPA: sterol desaturase family protein, partial [Acetobacteraceae bacterium]|nr:sterol desaturase family protein [Acetobacteraceae bacterium]
QAMITAYVEHIKLLLHQSELGQFGWLMWFADSTIDFLTSPLTGLRTRSYWPELVVALLIAGAIFVLRERRAGQGVRDFLCYCFPRRMFLHKSTWVDCQLIVLNNFCAGFFNLFWRFNIAFVTAVLISGLTHVFGPSPHLLRWTTATLLLFTALMALADDFGYYLFHLASHRIRWLWAFHKVHHSAETLTVFANVRVHPVEIAITGPFKAVTVGAVMAPAFYLGVGHPEVATILGINLFSALYRATGSQLHHTHIWLSWGRTIEHVLISPAMHQIHHSTAERHWNKNLGGSFALWDWIFGTIYIPHGREEITYGLGNGERQPHPNVLAAYLVPFWEILPGRERLVQEWRRLVQTAPGLLRQRIGVRGDLSPP